MRSKIYNFLVNRIPGISCRYHKLHDGTSGLVKVFSWIYLLWLNFCYYILFCRFLGKRPDMEYYESKWLPIRDSESASYVKSNPQLSVAAFVDRARDYDVVSFDVFDTLLFRPMAQPTDVFYLIGEKLGIMDFKNIRVWAEWDARIKCREKHGHMEVTLHDIWANLAEDTGCDPESGMRLEQEIELALCHANPFMLEVWKRLRDMGKRIIVISDMYLPQGCISRMLDNAGFTGAEKIYVSCELKKNKASGSLFQHVKNELGNVPVLHVGDNPNSDVAMAKRFGFDTCPYPNINHNMLLNRPFDMSYLVGSAYRGIVSAHLYNGSKTYSMEYEYGYLYGGLFVVGYCNFIHEYCENHHVDKLLFLSRDGDILKQVYDMMYPGEKTEYVYWSRKAATKLMANYDKHDYFRRFIYHKINQKYTIREVLHSMELDFLVEQLADWKEIWREWERKQSRESKEFVDLKADDTLTDKNGYLLRRFIEARWDQVLRTYESQQIAAGQYYRDILSGCHHAAAVDIGWAGSGAMALACLTEKAWEIPCRITGIIAGTNTIHNAEPDASEPFLQSGRLVAYLYSNSHNRDLLKKHDPNRDYNVFWELLLSSPTAQFNGFSLDENGAWELNFGQYDKNQDGIKEIQQGILAFAGQYLEHFKEFPYMFHISGRDSYAPMLVAASHDERYLKSMEKRFDLKINVN